ncbi:hypothetical protein O3P69_005385 [Scylla paramamosain]|uniref:Uncharacterized protein n=1 Tax=Scylla paramamosain TaxID=85552 RepID=A0AAW0U958_SCYPA
MVKCAGQVFPHVHHLTDGASVSWWRLGACREVPGRAGSCSLRAGRLIILVRSGSDSSSSSSMAEQRPGGAHKPCFPKSPQDHRGRGDRTSKTGGMEQCWSWQLTVVPSGSRPTAAWLGCGTSRLVYWRRGFVGQWLKCSQ